MGSKRSKSAGLIIKHDKNLTVSAEEALAIVMNSVSPLSFEDIPIMGAFKRILYEDIVSDRMIPPIADSAMDGYAIIADDTNGASLNYPVKLQVVGEIRAGSSSTGHQVSTGTAIRIMTGAPIPEGADSVARFEDTEEEGGYVKLFCETDRYENYRMAGEHIKEGEQILSKGNRLNSADVGILASLHRNTVKVYKQPTVSIISTGDELADTGEEVQIHQIRNSNAYTICSEVRKYGGLSRYLGIAKDSLSEMREIFANALKSDVIISTGGVSAGKYDLVKEVCSDLNIEIQFERIKIKPGRACVFGTKGNKMVFGLPGNPVPALISFIQFVRPALLRLMGANRINKPIVNAFLEEDIASGKIFHLVRGHFSIKNNEFYVSKTSHQKPSMLRSMSDANCLIMIPETITEVKAGEKVAIQLIDHDEI